MARLDRGMQRLAQLGVLGQAGQAGLPVPAQEVACLRGAVFVDGHGKAMVVEITP